MEKNKNIIRIKDIPSNTIEEAILILKENKKAKKYECSSKFKDSNYKKNDTEDYVVREAELIISDYIDSNSSFRKDNNSRIKKLKIVNIILILSLIVSIIL
ncbi:MAG: hypothetical protein IJH12_01065 [Clostridia bacterium]|nr:hypothetical protein [Clostridia bacterium]